MLSDLRNRRIKHIPGSCEKPSECVKRLNLAKTGGEGLDEVICGVLAEQPQAVSDYASGKSEAFNFLIGQVMKKTRGRVDPTELNRVMRETLDSRGS